MTDIFKSETCEGEFCRCGAPAVAKIGEEIASDDPHPHRHNLTAYVCARHYALVLGPTAARQVGYDPALDKPADSVIDRARLRRLREAAEVAHEISPAPWQHTPSTRTVHGNEAGYLADRAGGWIATFDGSEENDFAAEADPAVVLALIDLVEVLLTSLEAGSGESRASTLRRLSIALALKAGLDPTRWYDADLKLIGRDEEIDYHSHRLAPRWFEDAAAQLYDNLEVKLPHD